MSILSIFVFVLILGLIVLVHEFGHFITAKKSGVYIYEFAIGMGPKLLQKTGKDGIKYSIRLFPIGGYVQMAGEVYEDDKNIPKERFMCNRPWLHRIIIIIAGVVNNFILAFILLLLYGLIWGAPTNEPRIDSVLEDYPIAEAGIKKDDLIVAINNKSVKTWDKAQILLTIKDKDNTYKIKVKHKDGSYNTYSVKPKKVVDKKTKEKSYVFGLTVKQDVNKGIGSAIKYAFAKFGSIVETMWLTVINLFTGNISLGQLSGPVGVYQVVNTGIAGGLKYLIYITAFLSINVGFINILPLPAFDGGRAFFMLIEKIIGKPINSKIENTIHTIGFILLLALMIFITWHDIVKLF